jgi:plasmid stabilization system protein ParE
VTLPVRVRRRAEFDVDEAYAWYESRAEGLGEAFLRAVEACFARITRHPAHFGQSDHPFRPIMNARFGDRERVDATRVGSSALGGFLSSRGSL